MTVEAINIKQLVIQAGKRYVMRYGGITGVIKPYVSGTAYVWFDGYNTFTSTGKFRTDFPEHSLDLVAEYTQPEPLTFELKSGERYETVKPSGEAGPVVTLERYNASNDAVQFLMPFFFKFGKEYSYGVSRDGRCIRFYSVTDQLRIVRPYVEPKPPTNAEQLESALVLLGTMSRKTEDEAMTLIRGVIADLKAGAK